MGVFYLGFDAALSRYVAIKCVVTNSSRENANFIEEARLAAQLSHPNIMVIYDCIQDDSSFSPYLVLEYLQGETLRSFINKANNITPDRTLEILALIASSLDYAHSRGVVHCDIKPSNIFLTQDGGLRVLDFGISQIRWRKSEGNKSIGSPGYMAPEQIKGESLDGKTDLFALSVVLYEILYCTKPFSGDSSREIISRILAGNWVSVYQHKVAQPVYATKEFEEFFARAFARERKFRFGSGKELISELSPLLMKAKARVSDVGGHLSSPIASEVLGALTSKGLHSVRFSTNSQTSVARKSIGLITYAEDVQEKEDAQTSIIKTKENIYSGALDSISLRYFEFKSLLYAMIFLTCVCFVFFLFEQFWNEPNEVKTILPRIDDIILSEGRSLQPHPKGLYSDVTTDNLVALFSTLPKDASLLVAIINEARQRDIPQLPDLVAPLLVHGDPEVRIAAVRGFSHANAQQKAEKLTPLTKDQEYRVRREVVVVLGESDEMSVRSVLEVISVSDSHPQVRAAAKFMLEKK
jgi:serine/threonine protein kinase